jgi:DNA-binding MarR family transcriptional regulator
VLVLLSFSRSGSLPLSKVGERLMVHPTSVTNLVDRLDAQGLVERTVDDADRRRVLASLTPEGRRVMKRATAALTDIEFAVGSLDPADQQKAYELLRALRSSDFG